MRKLKSFHLNLNFFFWNVLLLGAVTQGHGAIFCENRGEVGIVNILSRVIPNAIQAASWESPFAEQITLAAIAGNNVISRSISRFNRIFTAGYLRNRYETNGNGEQLFRG